MSMNATQLRMFFDALVAKMGNAPSPLYRESVFSQVRFSDLDDEAKCELARLFIVESCPRIGVFASNGDAAYFLSHVARDIESWPKGSDLASRRLEHVSFAVGIIANTFSFTTPPGTLASVYLLHQLEFLFRALSGALTLDGTFVDANTKTKVEQQLGRKFGNRINEISQTYQIMCLNNGFIAPRVFSQLDVQLPQTQMLNGETLTSIGKRLAHFRHPVSHGPLANPSSEGCFYALLMAIALYGSDLFPRV